METVIFVMLLLVVVVSLGILIYMTYDPNDEYEAMMDEYREEAEQYRNTK